MYVVGGAVRDLLLGQDRADLDVVVEGDAGALARALGAEPVEHERFRTATVDVDGVEIDLASARSETYPHPGALPEVQPASLQEDLARRDFTVNAMAVPLAGDATLIDPHGGLNDLEEGTLRILHPASFADDPTRALRAARYAVRFGLASDQDTEARLRRTDLSTVSSDRVDVELGKLAEGPDARRGFELLGDWGLATLHPWTGELIDAVGEVLDRPGWTELADRRSAVLAAVDGQISGPRYLAEAKPKRPSEGTALAAGRDGVELVLGRALGAEWLDDYVGSWRHVRLEIDGSDLIEAGIPEGPEIGQALQATLSAKLDGEFAGRDRELAVALEAARGR